MVSHAINVVHVAGGSGLGEGSRVDFLDGQRGGLAWVPDGVEEWIFIPLTDGIEEPAGAVRVDWRKLADGRAGAGGYEKSSLTDATLAPVRELAAPSGEATRVPGAQAATSAPPAHLPPLAMTPPPTYRPAAAEADTATVAATAALSSGSFRDKLI